MPRLINKAEAADMLGVTVYTLDRIVAEGGLPMYKIRGSCRYYEHEVEAYIAAQRTVLRAPQARPASRQRRSKPGTPKCGYYPGMKVV